MARHRIALIGLGMAAKPHAQSLVDLADRVEIAAAYSRSAERRTAFAKQFSFPLTGDLDAIVNDRSITAVVILTPPNAHLDVVERMAGAGKHILLEKPVEVTTARARALVERCAHANVRLGVVFQHRFRPAALILAQRLAAGDLGTLARASVDVRWWRPQSYYDEPGRGTLARDGGGVLMTQAVHTLDLYLSLVGLPASVTAVATTSPAHRMETEDTVAGAMVYANGMVAALDATTASFPGFPERIELVGTAATAVLSGGTVELYFRDGRRETHGEPGASGGGADPMAFPNDAHRAVLAAFLDAIEAGQDPVNSGRAALQVHELIDALLESSRRQGPVAL